MDGRRQAALRGVVFTDMVGSTQLRSRLGDDRADALRRDHNALLGSAVTAHGGRVLRWTGDGMKADFPTASAALATAMDMQRAVSAYGQGDGAVSPFQIRIGVSAGEVVMEGNEAHGIAVIEAARLEPLAAPGEILTTDLARRLAQRRVAADFEEVGSFELKGLDEPVEVVRVIDAAGDSSTRLFSRTVAVDRRFPLVGRADEVGRALECWGDARSGSLRTVFVAGPSGIGKSRLVAQVADRAHAEGAIVLAGSCDSDLAVPYEPFAMAFAEAAATDDELGRAVASGAGALGALFPARRDRTDDPGPAARFELFEAVVGLTRRLARAHPVVLVLEDLHWATAPTVQLLRHLMRGTDRSGVLVLASYRPEEVGPGHPLHDLLTDQQASPSTVLRLTGLDAADVAELVAARAPYADDAHIEAFSRRIHDESAGSPLFACELLHHLASTGSLEQLVEHGDALHLPLPDSVRDLVEQRLGRLPDDGEEVLSLAAVIGAAFDLELLASLTEQSEAEVLDHCEALARLALVQEIDAGRFGFSHAVVRTTLVERQSASRQALAHRRIAEAIEALGRPDHDDLAHHWLQAGAESRANEHVERAAERDLEALAYESAADRYQALIDYHADDPTGDAHARARAWLGRARALRALGQLEYREAVQEAGRLARRLRDTDLLAEAAIASIWPGNFFVRAAEVEHGLVAICEDALAVLPDDDPRRVRVLAVLAAHLAFDADRERRVQLVAEGEAMARRLGDPELIGTVLVAEYLSLWDPSTSARRAEIAQEISRLARASGDVDLEFFAGFLAAVSATERGELVEAGRRIDGLAEVVTASQNTYFGFLVARLRTSLDLYTGQPDMQARIDALAEAYADFHADTTGTWAVQTGYLALSSGTFASVAPALEALLEESSIQNWSIAYGLALFEGGDRAGAEAILDVFTEPRPDYFWLTTMQLAADLTAALGRRDVAEWLFPALNPYRSYLAFTASGSVVSGLVATSLGELALVMGDHEVALDVLDEAVARAVAMGAPYEIVKAKRLLATALLAVEDPDHRAGPLVESATAMADERGFQAERLHLAALALLVPAHPAT